MPLDSHGAAQGRRARHRQPTAVEWVKGRGFKAAVEGAHCLAVGVRTLWLRLPSRSVRVCGVMCSQARPVPPVDMAPASSVIPCSRERFAN